MAERLTIDELIEHCNRQLDRFPSGNPLYREHEATRHYLQRLRHYIKTNLTPEEITDNMGMFKAYRHVCGGMPPEEVGRLKAEKDAAVKDARQFSLCLCCKNLPKCEEVDGFEPPFPDCDNWQWRGLKEQAQTALEGGGASESIL